MNIEFKMGPTSSIDPWTLERYSESFLVEDCLAYWVRVEGRSFRCLSDTKERIDSGENPEKVLMDALEFWRPLIHIKRDILGHKIEIGMSEKPPKELWKIWASGKSAGLTTGTRVVWIYIDSDPPFHISQRDYSDLMNFLKYSDSEEDIEIIKYVYKNN